MKTQYIKKSIVLAVLSVFALVPVLTFASVDTDLRYGSHGQEVTELQEFLIDKGFLQGQASGNFFSLTRKAVVAYQTSVQLPATGFVGPMTRGIINEDLAKNTSPEEAQATPVVTTSPDVTALLAKLAELQAQMKAIQTSNETMQTQQNTQTAQTNVILGSIAQNTTPVQAPVVVSPVGAPAPAPVPANPPVVTPVPVVATVKVSNSSPSSPITIGTGASSISIFTLAQPPQIYPMGTKWSDIQFDIVSNDFAKSDVQLLCNGNALALNEGRGCTDEIRFRITNPHTGKLSVIVTSAKYMGIQDGQEYPVTNLPLNSGEITIIK